MVTFEIRLDRVLYGLLVVIVVCMLVLMNQAPDVSIDIGGAVSKQTLVRRIQNKWERGASFNTVRCTTCYVQLKVIISQRIIECIRILLNYIIIMLNMSC